jgi:hypothetical protein
VGKLVGRAVIANDVDELHSISSRIDAAQDFILHWCQQVGGIKISGGGDEATMSVPTEAKDDIKNLRECVEKSFGYTLSVGVGRNLSEAGTALLVAKLRGKNRIIWFNKKIKEDIKKAKRRVREKRATPDEYKLAEAYLNKAEDMTCNLHKSHFHTLHKHEEGAHNSAEAKEGKLPANPDNEDNRTDDCAYCQDLDAEENADGTAGMHDCDMCREYDAKNGTSGGMDDCPMCQEYNAQQAGAMDDCPMCQEQDAQQNGGTDDCPMCQEQDAAQGTGDLENISGAQDHPEQPQDHICNCPYCVANGKDETDLAVKEEGAEHPDNCPDCQKMYGDAVENQPGQTGQGDPNLQGHETAEQVLDMLDQEPGAPGATPAQEAKQIDNTELPQGDQMRENVSVKDNFGDAQKGDISDADKMAAGKQPADVGGNVNEAAAEAGPDMAGVLQSGLDDHADEQKKQQVMDMVGQTLAGFKANKASLEATKEQNQALYNSCIQMLKSMIELCKLLGLTPKMPEQAPNDPGAVAEATQSGAPDGPKQSAPQAAPSGGAAEDPKARG